MEKTNNTAYYVKLTVTLFLISAIAAALLGLVNSITKDPIAQHKADAAREAMSIVLASDSYDAVDFVDETGTVSALYRAGDAGYVADVTVGGCQGSIEMMVGVDADGNVTGVSIVDQAETSGLGANCVKSSFLDQFIGGSSFAVSKEGGTIDSLTGATITSRAVCTGVNNAVAAVAALQ